MQKRGVFSKKINSNPQLEEAVFTYLKEKDQTNLSRVMEEGERLVYYFASFYSDGALGEDLVQVAYEGLLKAVKRFDPERGISFSTYACHYIKGEIRHYLRQEDKFYRPELIINSQNRVDRIIMKAGLVPLEEIEISKITSLRCQSLPFSIEDKILLVQALHSLSNIQRIIIYLLFFENYTQLQAGEKLGISQRKVSRILHRSLKQLCNFLTQEKNI